MSSYPTQGVSSLEAFKRKAESVAAERLEYPNLWNEAQRAETADAPIMREFFEAEEGSLLEEERARAAAIGYFVLTGLQLQYANEREKPIVSKRMTEAAIELWGETEQKEAQGI